MPNYDLAGNPLPDPDSPPSPQNLPPQGLPPRSPAPPPAAIDGAARYDLAGNPLPQAEAPSPPAAGNWSPPAQAAAWPPPPTGGAPYGEPARNDSGEKTGIPPEIGRFYWNWGAWFWTWIWCFAMGLPLFGVAYLALIVLDFVPISRYFTGFVSLGLTIYLAIKGYGLAWQNRHFTGGVPQFIDVQRAWLKWGVGLFVVSLLIIPILAAILFPVFMQARMKARMMNSGASGYTVPYSNGSGAGGSAPSGSGTTVGGQ